MKSIFTVLAIVVTILVLNHVDTWSKPPEAINFRVNPKAIMNPPPPPKQEFNPQQQ